MRDFAYKQRKFFIAPMILAALALFSALVMVLWNALLPDLFSFPAIRFWQAVGLLVLCRVLFGFGRFHGHGGHHSTWRNNLREKVSKMTPEERKEFFKKMHSMRHSWHREFAAENASTDNIKND